MKTGRKADMIRETLESLDHIQKAEAPPFFFTRLQARLDSDRTDTERWKWVRRPALSLAILTVLLLVNMLFMGRYLPNRSATGKQNTETSGIRQLVEEYDMDPSFVYNDKSPGQ